MKLSNGSLDETRAFDPGIGRRVHDERWAIRVFRLHLPLRGINARIRKKDGAGREDLGKVRVEKENSVGVPVEGGDRPATGCVELSRVMLRDRLHKGTADGCLAGVISLERHNNPL